MPHHIITMSLVYSPHWPVVEMSHLSVGGCWWWYVAVWPCPLTAEIFTVLVQLGDTSLLSQHDPGYVLYSSSSVCWDGDLLL